jgi:hypothetical protein
LRARHDRVDLHVGEMIAVRRNFDLHRIGSLELLPLTSTF